MSIAGRLEVCEDAEGLAAAAAGFIAARLKQCRAPFRLVLSGGNTPRATYRLLAARRDLPWDCVEIFFGDERFVPPDSPDSNYHMARRTLLTPGHVAPRGLFVIPTDGTPDGAAARYEETLRQQYGGSNLVPGAPLFDLLLLGMGDDGHTASLIPGQPVLKVRDKWVAAVPAGRSEARVTLTYPALESSRATVFLVTGADKAQALRRVRAGDATLPAGALRPQGEVVWFTDRAAAAEAG